MRYQKIVRFYGNSQNEKVRDILEVIGQVGHSWELTFYSSTYPVFSMHKSVFDKLVPLLEEAKIEYDDISTVTDEGERREYVPPRRLIIKFSEIKGKVVFGYREIVPVFTQYHSGSYKQFDVSGTVPEEIVNQGRRAVEAYAQSFVKNDLDRQWNAYRALKERDKNPNYPVTTEFFDKELKEKVILKGRIVSTEDTTLRVRLEEPYRGEKFVIYSFASSLAGRLVYDKQGNFTPDAISTAQRLLVSVYKSEKNKQANKTTIDLIEALNQEEE